ncbi:MAG: AI-2E family transporter [Chthoniobacterales bacterium]
MEPAPLDRRRFQTAFVLILVIAISALFLGVIWPFLQPLFLAAIFSGLCRPLFRWFVKICKGRRSLASALTLLVLFLLIAGPISAFVGVVINQAAGISDEAIPWLQVHLQASGATDAREWLAHRFPPLANYLPDQAKIVENAGNAAKAAGHALVAGASAMTASTANFLLNLFVMLYAMFFFLKDGTAILERIFYYIPLQHDDEVRMLDRLTSVTRATVKGTLLIGLIQGTLAGIGFAIAGIGGAAFWGTLMVLLSVVPGIGATLIWVPAVIFLFVSGQTLAGTLLGIWCAAVVGTIDNVLRPSLVGKDAKMPDLLIMVGTLGGLFLFGPIGFIIGPVICGLFLTAWDIYAATFKTILPPVHSLRTGEIKPAPTPSPAPEAPAESDETPAAEKKEPTPPKPKARRKPAKKHTVSATAAKA